ncbi:MAG: hypothetical protein JSW27_05315, partial [Phycisphaerales bacterium]
MAQESKNAGVAEQEVSTREGKYLTFALAQEEYGLEILKVCGQDIEDRPQFGAATGTDFILGMGKVGESVKILL